MTTKIVVFDPLGLEDERIAEIRQAAPSAQVVNPSEENLIRQLSDAEIFFGFHTPEAFRSAGALRWIQSTAAGLDAMLDAELIERSLIVTNASGVHAPQVSEAAWALTLAVSRGLHVYSANQREHRWEWTTHYDLDGSTAGILGLGGIGSRYARIAAAFGMRVLAVDPHVSGEREGVECLWTMDRLDDLLRLADVVLVSCPSTPKTRRLIGREQLALMKPSAILINIARGGIVDEDALVDALRCGKLAGAGTDVCETEPLPPESPLWDVPNLVITPHCAGLSANRMRRMTNFFCENLRRYFAGEPLLNVVDQKKGYPTPSA